MMDLSKVKGSWEQIKAALPDILASYDEDIDLAASRLTIKGKTSAESQKEQTAWPVHYARRKTEVNKLLKYIDSQVLACRSRLIRKYENYSRALSDRTVEKYIDNEPEYLSYYELYLEVEELRDHLSEICESFKLRGFALRDLTTLKVQQMQDDLI